MSDHTPRNDANLPVLGRMMTWVDKPGSGTKLFKALGVLCALLFIADIFVEKHSHFAVEDLPGFYGVYGFCSFVLVIYGAKTLRSVAKRDEDYYGEQAIDREDYPLDQTSVPRAKEEAHDA